MVNHLSVVLLASLFVGCTMSQVLYLLVPHWKLPGTLLVVDVNVAWTNGSLWFLGCPEVISGRNRTCLSDIPNLVQTFDAI